MRRLFLAGIAAFALAPLAPSPSHAEWDFGVRAGVYTDVEELFLGVEALTRVHRQWYFNPNVEWLTLDNGDLVTVNADFHYDLRTDSPFYVWLGGGPALVIRDPDPNPNNPGRGRGSSETDPGVNLLAGIGFNKTGAVRPYVQGKILLSDETEAVLAFGIRF